MPTHTIPADPLHRLWHAIARPPYTALPWLVLLYVIASCLIYTDNGPFTGHVVGFDDQSRMVQVLQWVNGGGWYDRVITRTDAPEGFHTIWARIVDVPLAAVILVAQLFTDQRSAALVAVVVVPSAELWLMFQASRYLARPIAGRNEAWLVLLFLMFTTVLDHKPYTLAGFHLGEASHHAWYGILNVTMSGAAVRVVLGVAGWAPRLMLGAAMALLLAVGIEGFPMIAGTVAILALLGWGYNNPYLTRRAAEAVGMGALLSLLLLPMAKPPREFFDVSFIQPSIVGPALLAAAALFLAAQHCILRRSRHHLVNALLLLTVAGVIAGGLLLIFPDMRNGALAGLSPEERQLAQNEHPEVWTMWKVAREPLVYVTLALPLFFAQTGGWIGAMQAHSRAGACLMLAYAGLAAVPAGLSQIWWRYVHHAESAACPLLLYVWQRTRAHLPHAAGRWILSLMALFALGPFWMVLLPAFLQNAPFLTQALFFPAKIYTEPYSCDTLSMTSYLNRHYPVTANINVPDWDTATFLYETDMHVDFLSNYPSHNHFIDNRIFFQSQDVEQSRQVALRHGFDLVAACTHIPMAPEVIASRPYREPTMVERLKEGDVPAWLKSVDTGIVSDYRLYEIDRARLAQPERKTP